VGIVVVVRFVVVVVLSVLRCVGECGEVIARILSAGASKSILGGGVARERAVA